MATMDSLKKLFARKKRLEDISLDDLKRERIRLDQEEKKYSRRIEEIEEDKKRLFMEGKDETSQRKQTILARKIKEKDAEAKNVDRNLQFFSRQLRIINGFVQLKENQRILQQSGISAIISNVDLQELQIYVDQATIDGVFHLDKFADILGTLEGSDKVIGPVKEDKDIMAIVAAMQEAKAAEEMDPEAADRGLEKVSKLLTEKEEPEADF